MVTYKLSGYSYTWMFSIYRPLRGLVEEVAMCLQVRLVLQVYISTFYKIVLSANNCCYKSVLQVNKSLFMCQEVTRKANRQRKRG